MFLSQGDEFSSRHSGHFYGGGTMRPTVYDHSFCLLISVKLAISVVSRPNRVSNEKKLLLANKVSSTAMLTRARRQASNYHLKIGLSKK